jgi:hypothetical protein
MKTIVHIGMPKTGSTALQNSLAASSAYLAQRGLLYPENPPGVRGKDHRLLAAQFLTFRALPRHLRGDAGDDQATIDARLEAFLAHLRRQIAAERPQGLILSYEGLFRVLPEARHETLRAAYRELGDDLRFVAYLRKPSEHYLSSLQQGIKASTTLKPPQPKQFRKILESYAACFGDDAVSARLFDRAHLANGDIAADFCAHALGAFAVDPAQLQAGERTNETLSAESMDLIWRYRRAFHAERDDVFTQDTNQLRRALARADHAHGAARPRLQPGFAEAIDYAAHDAPWLRDRFGVVFPGLDYDRFAAPAPTGDPAADLAAAVAAASGPAAAIDALVVVDREMQARILADLARSPWAADAARRKWLSGLARRGRPRPRPGPADAAPGAKRDGKRGKKRGKRDGARAGRTPAASQA